MRVTVTTASSKAGAATIRSLLEDRQSRLETHALYRDPQKAPAVFKKHAAFHAMQGSITDARSLDFSGSQVVVVILPPLVAGENALERCRQMCENVKASIKKAETVKRVILLSSYGAEFDKGVGELMTNHISEEVISTIQVPVIVVARCAYFMENWIASVDGFRATEPFFYSPLTPIDYKLPMIAVQDIGSHLAKVAASEEAPSSKPHIFDLWGPEDYSPRDVQKAFSDAMGKLVHIKPIEKDNLLAFFGQIFPAEIAALYTEMTESILPGGIAAVDSSLRDRQRETFRGKMTLQEFVSGVAKVIAPP